MKTISADSANNTFHTEHSITIKQNVFINNKGARGTYFLDIEDTQTFRDHFHPHISNYR
ncbi:MAG: hypothetical protein LIO79_03390 [Rikenellaceae bacterium]|nr:hypothetical protein [Rikenellaceae bacterium]